MARIEFVTELPPGVEIVNQIDLAARTAAGPIGALAFRYKHGWILINPLIPSRGRHGGGLARQHGHVSGTLTHGHFEHDGKGIKFVPHQTGIPLATMLQSHALTAKLHEAAEKGLKGEAAKKLFEQAISRTPEHIKYLAAQKAEAKLKAAQQSALKREAKLKVAQTSAEKYLANTAASKLSDRANAVSAGLKKADHLPAADAAAKHQAAAGLHSAAQKAHLKAGNPYIAKAHGTAADNHAMQARQFQAVHEAEVKAKAAEAKAKAAQQQAAANVAYHAAFDMPENTPQEMLAKAKAFEGVAKQQGAVIQHAAQHGLPGNMLGSAKLSQAQQFAKSLKQKADVEQAKASAATAQLSEGADNASLALKKQGTKATAALHEITANLHTQAALAAGKSGHLGLVGHHQKKALEHQDAARILHAQEKSPKVSSASGSGAGLDTPQAQKMLDALGKASDAHQALGAFAKAKAANIAAGGKLGTPEAKTAMEALSKAVTHGWPDEVLSKSPAEMVKHGYVSSPPKKAGMKIPTATATVSGSKAGAFSTKGWKKTEHPANGKPALVMPGTHLHVHKSPGGTFWHVTDGNGKKLAVAGTQKDAKAKAVALAEGGNIGQPKAKVSYAGMTGDKFHDASKVKALIKQAQQPGATPTEKAVADEAKADWKAKYGSTFDPGYQPPGGGISSHVGVASPKVLSEAAKADMKALTEHHYPDAAAAGYTMVNTQESAHPKFTPTAAQRKGPLTYSGSAYGAINAQLRHGVGPTGGSYDDVIKSCDAAFKAVPPLEHGIVVGRKMKGSGPFPEFPPPMQPGAEYVDKGYSSTSKLVHMWTGDTEMEIRVPAGTRVLDLNHSTGSHNSPEQEILLNRGTRYRIISDTQVGAKRKIVVEVVNSGDM